jgi:glycosyltransferase involved in cell wall biosynthesis
MTTASTIPNLKILHVLTLIGQNGEYGGPVRVARELCTELSERGHSTQILSGSLEKSEPRRHEGVSETYVTVKPVSMKFAVSSLWSWRLLPQIRREIRKADVVHIHFARDLIPLLTALIALMSKKPYITQTHGMILSDNRLSTRIIDRVLTRPLINKSRLILVLTETESSLIKELDVKSPVRIFPNGIAQYQSEYLGQKSFGRIAFCSRLDKRKGIIKFIDLAESFKSTGLHFEIYGPDGGELKLVLKEIKSRNLADSIEYKGALPARKVQPMLEEIDLLVLPSRDEPFPMIILEALAVGTSVLVMPSCGLADNLRVFESNFVAETEDFSGLISAFKKQYEDKFSSKSQTEIAQFCRNTFGMNSLIDQLENLYMQAIKDAK